jgi:hypothetical protein
MNAQKLKEARKGMKRVKVTRGRNKLREARLEALRVLDHRGRTRVACKRRWVQSYIALRLRNQ